MTGYKRITVHLGNKGKAVLEYKDGRGRVTLQIRGLDVQRLWGLYLLWEDRFILLTKAVKADRNGSCFERYGFEDELCGDIAAVAVISDDLEPFAIGYIRGEYNWQRCFMMKEQEQSQGLDTFAREPEAERESREEAQAQDQAQAQASPQAPQEDIPTEEKQAFKAIVCRLNEDIKELREYTSMPDGAELLFKDRSREQPFFGCKGEWIKINLRELAAVGFLWKYINNPLVLYSCRKYHYLYLGRNEGAFMLALPWEYDPAYRLEAGVQGFTEIKPIENKPLEKGDRCCLVLTT